MLVHFPVYIIMNQLHRLILTFAIGRTIVLKAARYSASPIGGERPPDHATFTEKPTPSPTPHCNNRKTKIPVVHCQATCRTVTSAKVFI
jgi:hypothetical protein